MTPGTRALNRLAKWRSILAGWQLGTKPKGDPVSDAVRDHREVTLLLRAEVNALVQLMVAKGVFTAEEFDAQLVTEAEHLERAFEAKFPGAKASDDGMVLDRRAEAWMKNFPP
jgi:hypothetical protein